MELIRRIIADDVEALDLLDKEPQNPVGNNAPVSNSNRRTGTTKEYALRRLRKGDPALHAEVLAGNLSPHAAMVKAGRGPAPTRTDRG